MVVRATLAALLVTMQLSAGGPAPTAAPAPNRGVTLGWSCSHSVERSRGRLEVTRNLDADGRPEYDYLFWQSRSRDAAERSDGRGAIP